MNKIIPIFILSILNITAADMHIDLKSLAKEEKLAIFIIALTKTVPWAKVEYRNDVLNNPLVVASHIQWNSCKEMCKACGIIQNSNPSELEQSLNRTEQDCKQTRINAAAKVFAARHYMNLTKQGCDTIFSLNYYKKKIVEGSSDAIRAVNMTVERGINTHIGAIEKNNEIESIMSVIDGAETVYQLSKTLSIPKITEDEFDKMFLESSAWPLDKKTAFGEKYEQMWEEHKYVGDRTQHANEIAACKQAISTSLKELCFT